MIKNTDVKKLASDIDGLLCGLMSVGGSGELSALASWVNKSFLRQLEIIVNGYLVDGNKISLRLAWIDKSPIAYLDKNNFDKPGVEIADVALFHVLLPRYGLARARMFLLQAKAADGIPYFPSSDHRENTEKELELLSDWPVFKLKQWSASGQMLGPFSVLDKKSDVSEIQSIAWFSASSLRVDSLNGVCSPWWCTPPIPNVNQNISLGVLLADFITNQQVDVPADANGALHQITIGKYFGEVSDWTKLCEQIIVWSAKSTLPSIHKDSGESRLIDIASVRKFMTQCDATDMDCESHSSDFFKQNDCSLESDEFPESKRPMPVIFVVHEE